MSAWRSESPPAWTAGCLSEREAASDARASGTLPPIPFLHFSWSFTEAGGQRETEGSWEGGWEQHHKLRVLPGALNPVWHLPLLTNPSIAGSVFHTAAPCSKEATSALLKHFSTGFAQVQMTSKFCFSFSPVSYSAHRLQPDPARCTHAKKLQVTKELCKWG